MSCDIQSIKKRADFIKLSKEGFSSPQKGLVLQAKSNEELCTSQLIRFGVTATKKIGPDVIYFVVGKASDKIILSRAEDIGASTLVLMIPTM